MTWTVGGLVSKEEIERVRKRFEENLRKFGHCTGCVHEKLDTTRTGKYDYDIVNGKRKRRYYIKGYYCDLGLEYHDFCLDAECIHQRKEGSK